MAKGALDHGASPRAVFEALRLDPRYIETLEKLYNPAQPRVPAGYPEGGQWTSGDWGGSANASSEVLSDATPDSAWKPGAQYAANEPPSPGIGHNQGPPLEDPPEIPKVGPAFNTRAFWNFVKVAARWLARAGWRPVLPIAIRMGLEATVGGRIGQLLFAMERPIGPIGPIGLHPVWTTPA